MVDSSAGTCLNEMGSVKRDEIARVGTGVSEPRVLLDLERAHHQGGPRLRRFGRYACYWTGIHHTTIGVIDLPSWRRRFGLDDTLILPCVYFIYPKKSIVVLLAVPYHTRGRKLD